MLGAAKTKRTCRSLAAWHTDNVAHYKKAVRSRRRGNLSDFKEFVPDLAKFPFTVTTDVRDISLKPCSRCRAQKWSAFMFSGPPEKPIVVGIYRGPISTMWAK